MNPGLTGESPVTARTGQEGTEMYLASNWIGRVSPTLLSPHMISVLNTNTGSSLVYFINDQYN